MRRLHVPLLLLLALLGLAAAQGAMAAGRNPSGAAAVSIGQVTDLRSDHSNRIGTIRSRVGIPIRSVDSDQPVPQAVAGAFAGALQSRGLLAPQGSGRYRLDIAIRRLEADKLRRSEAHAAFGVTLVNQATGARLYQDEAAADTMTGYVMGLEVGVFANSGEMKQQVQQTMTQAIDGVLGKPGFAAALRR